MPTSQLLLLVFSEGASCVPGFSCMPVRWAWESKPEPGSKPWGGGSWTVLPPALHWPLPVAPRVPEEPGGGAEEPASPEESSGLSLLHQESQRRAMLAEVLKQELPQLAEDLWLEQEQVGGPPQRPLVAERRQDAC